MAFFDKVPLLSSVVSFIKRRKLLSTGILIVLLVIGFFLWPKTPPVVETQKIVKGDIIQSITASGTVTPNKYVNLSFLTGGKVVYLGVKKGDFVKEGQVIAQLDLRSAEKSLQATLKDYANQRNTFDQGLANYNVTRPAEAGTDAVKRILETNQNNLDKAVISTELQSLAKENSVLTTPIAGVVTRADITSAGVNVGATTTFVVADPQDLIFAVDIDEADIGKVRENQVVKLTLDAYPNETISLPITKVDFASHATSTGGTAYTVETALPLNADYRYKIGMSGDGEIIVAQRKNVLIVPLSSVTESSEVYVKKQKTYEKRKVTLGLKNDTDAQVLSGLEAGDEVVLQPSDVEGQIK